MFTKLFPEIVTAFPPTCGPLFATTDSTLGSATGYWLEQAKVDAMPAVTVDGDIAAEPHVVGLGWNRTKVFAPYEYVVDGEKPVSGYAATPDKT
jgi:hypothetical protein